MTRQEDETHRLAQHVVQKRDRARDRVSCAGDDARCHRVPAEARADGEPFAQRDGGERAHRPTPAEQRANHRENGHEHDAQPRAAHERARCCRPAPCRSRPSPSMIHRPTDKHGRPSGICKGASVEMHAAAEDKISRAASRQTTIRQDDDRGHFDARGVGPAAAQPRRLRCRLYRRAWAVAVEVHAACARRIAPSMLPDSGQHRDEKAPERRCCRGST